MTQTISPATVSPAQRLRNLLAGHSGPLVMPCCFDGLSAHLIEAAGFPLTFMSGYAVSAARLGLPDAGLISYGEIVDQGRNICAAVSIPVIGDGDTGYGNAVNVKRSVRGYAQAGFASIMLEDQVWPKRCGHTKGKQVVGRDEAVARVRAAADARDEGADILILARTDARATHGLDEALERARAFKEAGADILFVEAPQTEAEMARVCAEVPGDHMANMVEDGATPFLPPERLDALGYRIVAYPVTLLRAAIKAMTASLDDIKAGNHPHDRLIDFAELCRVVGFEDYYAEEARYGTQAPQEPKRGAAE
jgi:2-methylisocitrate lyase-like PEP mutase family enzyme